MELKAGFHQAQERDRKVNICFTKHCGSLSLLTYYKQNFKSVIYTLMFFLIRYISKNSTQA